MNGILFKDSMIQAIIEGRKTQTRRIIKFHKPFENPDSWEVIYPDGGGNWIAWDKDRQGLAEFTKKAYPNGEGFKSKYHIGQKLYIKEAWRTLDTYDNLPPNKIPRDAPIYFESDIKLGEKEWLGLGKKRSPMFLMEWMARYFIEITNVESQRLQEITEGDAKAEGGECVIWHGQIAFAYENREPLPTYKAGYANLWDSINGRGDFALNKWVWKYTFKQVK